MIKGAPIGMWLLGVVAAFNPAALSAQQPDGADGLQCANFVKNADGSWSPSHPITVNGLKLIPGGRFPRSVIIAGLNLAIILDERCK